MNSVEVSPGEQINTGVATRGENRERPLLSIGMPVYNASLYIRETIDSILAQDYPFELVISDNGSTDETPAIAREYAARDPRIRYYRYSENRGAAWNYNNCFSLAKGDYFKWAAHDDKLAPDFCSRCIEVLEENPDVILAYCGASVIDENGKMIRYDSDQMDLRDEKASQRFRKYFQAYKGHNICNPVFGIFRTGVLGRTGLIGNFLSSDQMLLGEIALNGKVREIPEGLFLYRWHPQNSMYGLNCAERVLWFDPNNKGKLCLLYCLWFRNYLAAISKAPLSMMERFRCSIQVYAWAFQNRGAIAKELIKAMLWPVLKRTLYRNRGTGM